MEIPKLPSDKDERAVVLAEFMAAEKLTQRSAAKVFNVSQPTIGRWLKSEIREKNREYYKTNKKKISERQREHYKANREKICERQRAYQKANREKICERDREYKKANREKIRERDREYKKANRKKILGYAREYYKTNKEKIRKWKSDYQKTNREKIREYRKTNRRKFREWERGYRNANRKKIREKNRKYQRANLSFFSCRQALGRIARRVRSFKPVSKTALAKALVGCEEQEFRDWMEMQFEEGMTWENYGEWHIDHVIPLASIDEGDPKFHEKLAKLCHYTNLQPLWGSDNQSKGATPDRKKAKLLKEIAA